MGYSEVRATTRVFNLLFRVPAIKEQFGEVQRLTNMIWYATKLFHALQIIVSTDVSGARLLLAIASAGTSTAIMGTTIAGFTDREEAKARSPKG